MWTRKTLKRTARRSLKRNYWRMVIVCLIMLTIAGTYQYSTQLTINVFDGIQNREADFFPRIVAYLQNLSGEGEFFATRGVLSTVVRASFSAGSMIRGLATALWQLLEKQNISAAVLLFIGVAVYILYSTFVTGVLAVGEARYFLESRSYMGVQPNRLLFVYRVRRTRHVAMVMFLYGLAILGGALTIVGGFIVAYQLTLVPFILAENPNATRAEAFRLSRSMMKGNKWRTFLLDISYVGWYILSLCTFGLVGMLYANPYRTATRAELYTGLRENVLAQTQTPGVAAVLHDTALFPREVLPGAYPPGRFDIPESEQRRWLTLDYDRKYSFTHIILMFFSFTLIGWIWEVAIEIFGKGIFVNRGTLFGPWIPLYGCGGVLVVLLLRRFAKKPVLTFFLAVGLLGTLEYCAGLALELIMGVKWWDYTGYLLNIHGRVCAEGLIVFGLGACLGIYLLAPLLDDLFKRIPKRVKVVLCVVLLTLFAADVLYSFQNPNMGEHITFSLDPAENIDLYYGRA